MKACIVGFGLSGRTFHLPLLRAAGIEVVSVAVRTPPETHLEGISFTTFDAACADPSIDLMVITTPNELHHVQAVQAIEAGKHVVVEKPIATTSKDARAIAAAASKASRVASVFHSRRWDGDFLTLRGMLRDGAVGQWQILESRWGMNKVVAQQRWKDRADQGGGLLMDFMPHLLDQALFLFDAPQSISLETATQRDGAAAADYLSLTMRYGQRRVVLSVDCFSFGAQPRFRLAGSTAEYTSQGVDPQEGQLRAGMSPLDHGFGASAATRHSQLTTPDGRMQAVAMSDGGYIDYYRELVASIDGNGPPPVALQDAVRVVEILEQLARTGSWGSIG